MKGIVATCLILLVYSVYATVCLGYVDTYPHKSWCPQTGSYLPGDYYASSVPCDAESSGFCQCNCTAYIAWKLKEQGLFFSNGYLGASWGNGNHWDDAARSVNIGVDRTPLPGDIAYWNNKGGYGHVAWVERVYFDDNGNPISVDVSQYNISPLRWSTENIPVSDPDGYIHALLYGMGVMFYVDSLEMFCGEQWSEPPFSNQSCNEAGKIIYKLSAYSNVTVSSEETTRSLAYFGGPGSGGGSYTFPDFIVKKIWLEDTNGNAKTTFKSGERIRAKGTFKNVGTNSPQDVKVKFYLSNGHNVDSNKQQAGSTDNIRNYNMESGESQAEGEEFVAPTTSGTYNITTCIDTDNNVAEEHESNNCSDEAVFMVKKRKSGLPISTLLEIISD